MRECPRRRQVLELLSYGYTRESAAVEMGIETNSVKSHAQLLRNELGVHTAAHAVRRGFELGWLRLDGDRDVAGSDLLGTVVALKRENEALLAELGLVYAAVVDGNARLRDAAGVRRTRRLRRVA